MFRRMSVLLYESVPETDAHVQEWAFQLRPITRALILNQYARPDGGFLETVVAVCQTLQIAPVVLTVAGSESEARRRERIVADFFAKRGLIADFDSVTGCDVPTAVARAAQWRRCSHVFVERRVVSLWRRWLFGDIMNEFRGLSDSVTVVAVPGATPPPSAEGLPFASRKRERQGMDC
jgi:K+-sensing histidine kinase KdpD